MKKKINRKNNTKKYLEKLKNNELNNNNDLVSKARSIEAESVGFTKNQNIKN